MAGEDRRSTSDIKRELLEEGKTFSFFQALRLLGFFIGKDRLVSKGQDPIREMVRIRPKLSLAHPGAEIDVIEELETDSPKYRLTANFLGLYGESSPLPTFYTEDLLDADPDSREVAREFVDIINYPLYLHFFRIWTKYRPWLKIVDEKDQNYLDMLFALLGLGVEGMKDEIPGSYQLLRYVGLFTQFPKSAAGLKRLLGDALDEKDLDIVPCIPRTVSIPQDQRCYVGESGNVLGEESYLGECIGDVTRKYRVKIGPVDAYNFRQYLPGTYKYRRIVFLSRIYLMDPYESDLEIELAAGEIETAQLGDGQWSKLGMDTWTFSGDYDKTASTLFELS